MGEDDTTVDCTEEDEAAADDTAEEYVGTDATTDEAAGADVAEVPLFPTGTLIGLNNTLSGIRLGTSEFSISDTSVAFFHTNFPAMASYWPVIWRSGSVEFVPSGPGPLYTGGFPLISVLYCTLPCEMGTWVSDLGILTATLRIVTLRPGGGLLRGISVRSRAWMRQLKFSLR